MPPSLGFSQPHLQTTPTLPLQQPPFNARPASNSRQPSSYEDDRQVFAKLKKHIRQENDSRGRKMKLPKHMTPSRADPYSPFFIPHPILLDTTHSAQETSLLLSMLPPELLAQIFQQIEVPYFQICFALTCKTIGRIASGGNSNGPGKHIMSPWRGWRDKDGLFRLLQRGPINKIPTEPWIPSSLRLCKACFLFVPKSRLYWASKIRDPIFDRKDLNWIDTLNFFDETAIGYAQHRCPFCVSQNFKSYAGETIYASDREDDEMWVYLREIGGHDDLVKSLENVRKALQWRVCPDLHQRIDRP